MAEPIEEDTSGSGLVEEQANPISLSLFDPLQDLCPSLEILKELCEKNEEQLKGGEKDRQSKLYNAMLKATSNNDQDLLLWLCSRIHSSKVQSNPNDPFKNFDWNAVRDEEGSGPVILASSCGHVDVVRTLIQAGAEVDERDGSGWTPLMWAINQGNLPLVSFLLSHGADSEAKTSKGVSCEDFIISAPQSSSSSDELVDQDRQLISDIVFEHQRSRQQEREKMTSSALHHHLRALSVSEKPYMVGDPPHSPGKQSVLSSSIAGHSRSSSTTMRRLVGHTERTQIAESELRARELAEGRRRALLDVATMLQVDYQHLLGEQPVLINPVRSRSKKGKPVHSGLASGCGAIEVGSDPLSYEFDFDEVRADQMLVFGEKHIEPIIALIVGQAKPVRAPWTERSRPANVMYLCLRYTCTMADEDLQEELLFSFVNAVEAMLYAKPTELTHLAFWLHNSILLLHYLNRDGSLFKLEATKEYRSILTDLVNEIYIFIVRDVERRIDKIVEAAILEYESIPAYGDEGIRYEDQWSILSTIKGSVRGLSGSSPAGSSRRPLSQIFAGSNGQMPDSPRNGGSPASTMKHASISSSPLKPGSMSKSSPLAMIFQESDSATNLLAKPSPRTITSLLTSVLHILQLYEINPSVIVQALSQIFYWVGCESFNRILINKRFVCKNKAMQIRLNISTLEDWVKTNALPLTLINYHFAKVNQLISWILCQSSLSDFDSLIVTLQGLKSLNPIQLRHTLSEYRYEVGEGRMQNECVQYLDQLVKDWKRGIQQQADNSKQTSTGHGRSGTATQADPQGMYRSESFEKEAEQTSQSPESSSMMMEQGGDSTAMMEDEKEEEVSPAQVDIDSLFLPGRSMNDYVPKLATTTNEEANNFKSDIRTANDELMLNSRDMLPFALPSLAENLIVSPGDAFGFGRGHFMGTGTPSLKSMRTNSLVPSPSISERNFNIGNGNGNSSSTTNSSSRPSSPLKRMTKSSPQKFQLGLGINVNNSTNEMDIDLSGGGGGLGVNNDETISITSSSHLSVLSTSSSVFPQGKGLAAGGTWQPVPVLPESTLEVLNKVMR